MTVKVLNVAKWGFGEYREMVACIEALEWSMAHSSSDSNPLNFHLTEDIEMMVALLLEFSVVVEGWDMGHSGKVDKENDSMEFVVT